MGFFTVLQLILITLKLIGLIKVSWFVVFLPAIIGLVIAIILFILYFKNF